MARVRRSEGGFLLVEALVAMALIGIAFALFAEFASMITNRSSTLTRQAYLTAQGRAGIDMLSNDLQSAMCNGIGTGAIQPVTTATSTQVVFYSPDRQDPYHLRQLTYTLTGGALTRIISTSTNSSLTGPPNGGSWSWGSASPAAVVVDSVQNTTMFRYYDASGTELSAPVTGTNLAKIYRVTMTLTLLPTASHGTGAITTQGSATIRTWTTQQQCPSL